MSLQNICQKLLNISKSIPSTLVKQSIVNTIIIPKDNILILLKTMIKRNKNLKINVVMLKKKKDVVNIHRCCFYGIVLGAAFFFFFFHIKI